MPEKKDDFDTALEAIARLEDKTVEQVKLEMLRNRLGGGARDPVPREEKHSALARRQMGDASGGGGSDLARMREEAMERHHASPAAYGSPVVRYSRDPYSETPAEAAERWLEEEAELPDGVHGLGGQTAGGIFGTGPIATSVYDPEAMARGDARVGQMANIKILGLVERLSERLDQLTGGDRARGALPGAPRRRLGPKR